MIKILTNQQSQNPKNVYKITHDWMLGDSDGDTSYSQFASKDNPHLDKFLECCDKLTKPLPGTWANILEISTIKKCLKEDFDFFKQFLEYYNDDVDTINRQIINDEFVDELIFDPITERGSTFVSYHGFEICFYDENGNKFNCEWIK